MEANTETTKAAASKANAPAANGEDTNQMAQRLNEFTEGLQETFDRAQQQLSSAVTRIREEASNMDLDGARVRAKTWVEENPTLSVALAVGAGLLLGKALGSALTPEPPTFKKRALKQAHRMQRYATDLSGELAQKAALAGGAVLAGTTAAATVASRKAQEVGHVVAEGAQHLGHRAVDYAEGVLDQVQDVTKDGRKQFKKKSKKARRQAEHGLDFAGSLLDAARTATAAVVVKKITDWTRKVA